ncbi:hypothetical protein PC120_g12537 [Phytophthora cactorum]|nr:hypothetical protein PC120_g12537 [Phytophthora cactorum]
MLWREVELRTQARSNIKPLCLDIFKTSESIVDGHELAQYVFQSGREQRVVSSHGAAELSVISRLPMRLQVRSPLTTRAYSDAGSKVHVRGFDSALHFVQVPRYGGDTTSRGESGLQVHQQRGKGGVDNFHGYVEANIVEAKDVTVKLVSEGDKLAKL